METLGLIGFVGCLLSAMACWFVGVVNSIRAIALRKPGVSMWRGTLLNPGNLLLQPEKLTEAGLAARQLAYLGYLGFAVFCFLAMLIGCATGIGMNAR